MASEFFAAEFWPDSGKNDAKHKSDDELGGISNDGSKGGDTKNERPAARGFSEDSDNLGDDDGNKEWCAFVMPDIFDAFLPVGMSGK